MLNQDMIEDENADGLPTGEEKAAALLISLGADTCAEVFKILSDDEVEDIANVIAGTNSVDSSVMSSVVEDLGAMTFADVNKPQGGISYITEALGKALGTEDSREAVERVSSNTKSFALFAATPSATEMLHNTIRDEHPQTIALILVHIQEQRAAEILGLLPPKLQTEVVTRIANMAAVSPGVITQIEESLQASSRRSERVNTGGVRDAAEILNRVDTEVEKRVMKEISEEDQTLAEEIADLMFTYDDIVMITDAGIQTLVREVDAQDLVMALRASTEVIKNKFLDNVSERRREVIHDDIDNMPPVRLKDALAAQRRILTQAKAMSVAGTIEIIRDQYEDVFV